MELAELSLAIQDVDPAVVLVTPRIMRRVLQSEYKVPHLLVHAPHEWCYSFERQVLFRHVEQDELDLEPDRLLPSIVTLMVRPSTEQLQALGKDAVLLRFWRILFHAHVHLALNKRISEGRLTAMDVRQRIAQLGQTEFEEIRTVLEQEEYLLPPREDVQVYVEFAAVYLELRYFRSNLRATYFPALSDFEAIDRLLAQDIDADEVFTRTRLAGAPDPVVRTDTSSDESNDYYWRLIATADRAVQDDDIVRAAILRTRAARVAPAALAPQTREDAFHHLEVLTKHLQDTLHFTDDEAGEWLKVLPELLDKADQGKWPVEAKLLHDLQNAYLENQQKLYTLDIVEWLHSMGKRPIKRPLTSLQIVHTTKHLRSAAARLTQARVSDEHRQLLVKLLKSAVHLSEQRLRERFRPILENVFDDVGLRASSPPEKVALEKMIEEILDRIKEYGFFTFTDLRDTISRNQLKLPSINDPYSYWQGDPLQQLDKRLYPPLEGVYRRGEFYMRGIESLSSLFFGTALGRFFTLNIILPFGGAYALVEGVKLLYSEYFGGSAELPDWTFGAIGLFFLMLMHSGTLRGILAGGVRTLGHSIYFLGVEGPVRLWNRREVQHLFHSWPSVFFRWYVLKPLAVVALLHLAFPEHFGDWGMLIMSFLMAVIVLNHTRLGSSLNEAFVELFIIVYSRLRFDVLQGVVRITYRFFKQISSAVEYVLYSVDERLRFRGDESQVSQLLRGALTVLWFPFAYLIRLYFVLFIEPTINPFKLPISSLAFKFMLLWPLYVHWMNPATHIESLVPHTGVVVAVVLTFVVIVPTLWLFPSIVAFFIWEMQGNWQLFRANRPQRLKPVSVGTHGETVKQLLRPGFHSGTIPKLYGQLRRAERAAYRTGSWRQARAYREGLEEVARAVQLFVEREFIMLVRLSKTWREHPISCGQVVLSCNRIRIEVVHTDYHDEPVWLSFELSARWLVAGILQEGWLHHLDKEQQEVIDSALAGLYKLAGVDMVREQLREVLPASVTRYDLTSQQLLVWTEQLNGQAVAYNLRANADRIAPVPLDGHAVDSLPHLHARDLFFSRVPLTWEEWNNCWSRDRDGEGHPHLLNGHLTLVPRRGPLAADTQITQSS
ncbi:MAG: hypothetical protein AB7K24_27695 [Gemmataceae bacterium]